MLDKEVILRLAKDHDSFYLYDEKGIRDQAGRLKQALKGVRFLYSVKCNPHP